MDENPEKCHKCSFFVLLLSCFDIKKNVILYVRVVEAGLCLCVGVSVSVSVTL